MVGAEPEFMLLKQLENGTFVPWDKMDNAAKPCYDMRSLNRNLDLLTKLIGYMQELVWNLTRLTTRTQIASSRSTGNMRMP